MYVREDTGQIGINRMLPVRTDRVTYMNKGGTAERIGHCDEGLIVPAVFCTVERQGDFANASQREIT